MNDPVEDWKKQRKSWLGYLKERACYGNMELAERNLIPTSGYFYTLLKNQGNLDKKRNYQLMATALKMECEEKELPKKYDELLAFTGIDYLRRRMETDIVSKYQDLLRGDIASSYSLLKENISDLMRRVRERQEEVLSNSAKSLEQIREKEAENQRKLEEARRDQEELADLFAEIKKDASERKQRISKAIRELGGTQK